jgi:apolipoprotein N-acyltransferase
VGGLAAACAVYWGLATAAAGRLVRRGFSWILVFPICLSAAEWLRGILFTGFPWAVPGLAADGMGGVEQLASLFGMNGLTLLILLWAAAIYGLCTAQRKTAVVILLTLPVAWGWGQWRLMQNPTQFVAGVGLRLVQPNISQSDKWRGDNVRVIFNQLMDLSSRPMANDLAVTHIIWPESAVPFLIDESPEGKAELGGFLDGHKILMTGAEHRSSPRPIGGVDPKYYTSILVFDGAANVIATYDKFHLVPGGEYLPLGWLLQPLGIRQLAKFPEDFTPGSGPTTLLIPGAGRVGAQICYEAIFPSGIISSNPRPDWLLNVTNDGWFGNSSGPYQHLAQLRLRAVEQGLPIARSANTGISAVIDPLGRYIQSTKLGTVDTRDSRLPAKIQPTVYALMGEYGFLSLLILAIMLCGGFRVRV